MQSVLFLPVSSKMFIYINVWSSVSFLDVNPKEGWGSYTYTFWVQWRYVPPIGPNETARYITFEHYLGLPWNFSSSEHFQNLSQSSDNFQNKESNQIFSINCFEFKCFKSLNCITFRGDHWNWTIRVILHAPPPSFENTFTSLVVLLGQNWTSRVKVAWLLLPSLIKSYPTLLPTPCNPK